MQALNPTLNPWAKSLWWSIIILFLINLLLLQRRSISKELNLVSNTVHTDAEIEIFPVWLCDVFYIYLGCFVVTFFLHYQLVLFWVDFHHQLISWFEYEMSFGVVCLLISAWVDESVGGGDIQTVICIVFLIIRWIL